LTRPARAVTCGGSRRQEEANPARIQRRGRPSAANGGCLLLLRLVGRSPRCSRAHWSPLQPRSECNGQRAWVEDPWPSPASSRLSPNPIRHHAGIGKPPGRSLLGQVSVRSLACGCRTSWGAALPQRERCQPLGGKHRCSFPCPSASGYPRSPAVWRARTITSRRVDRPYKRALCMRLSPFLPGLATAAVVRGERSERLGCGRRGSRRG
jgi:hypothetical protein